MNRTRKTLFALSGLAVVAAVLGGFSFWYLVLRSDSPPPATIAGAIESITPQADGADVPANSGAGGDLASTSEGLDGTWTPDTTQSTFVGYRVGEELARVGTTTAVGRTPKVTGEVVIDGESVTSATIEADLTALQSDSSMRDGQLRNQGLQTSRFPTATFVLGGPLSLPAALAAGEAVDLTLEGQLTLHGVTRDVAVPVQAQLKDGYLAVVGSTEIVFADYDISKPSGASVLSIEDHGTLEIQLILAQA